MVESISMVEIESINKQFKSNNRDIQQENNALYSGIDEINNFFIERRIFKHGNL